MADSCYAFCSSHSQPSSPPGDNVKDSDEDKQFQETELFNDTLLLNSPFTKPQVENLNLNTAELVEDSDPEEKNMESGPRTRECGHEVVLDSEDEEMDNGEVVTAAAKGLLDDGTSPTARIPSMRFRKRLVKSPCEQVESNATTFRKADAGDKRVSIDAKRFNDNSDPCLPARLNHINSPEPGDPTLAALGFVDQYLSSNDMDLFQGINHTKAVREKSSHVLSARGSLLSLARKIKSPTQTAEKEPFRWVDSDQIDKGAGFFSKKTDTSANFGTYRQKYVRKRQEECSHLQNQGTCGTGNRCAENLFRSPGMVAENNNSCKELNVLSNVNAYSSVIHTEEMFDIGLDTQMAAEVMEALAFVPPTSYQFDDDAHPPENALDGCLSDLTNNEAPSIDSLHRQNSGLQSITKSKKRNASSCSLTKVTSSSSPKHSENQELNPISNKMRKMMESNQTVEGQVENNTNSPIQSEHVSLEEICSTVEYTSCQPVAKEPKNRNQSRWTRIKDQPKHHTGKNNNLKAEKGTISHKRKSADLVADPLKLGIRRKRSSLPANLYGKASRNKLNHQVQVSPQLSATKSFLINDLWHYPKRPRGKRKKANVQNNHDAPSILCIDGKENNVYSTVSLKGQDDEDKSCFPQTHPLCKASFVDNGRCLLQRNSVQPGSADEAMKLRNPPDMHPLLQAHVEVSSNKSGAQSSSEIPATIAPSRGINISNANHTYNEHIRLGVSEPTKRQRRGMTFVRVLFSQHLDDSIVKQQKKILARLNISVVSSSMEATHFIADKFIRTRNMLETMALGKSVVTHSWLESCRQAKCLIDEKNYILRDVKKEKELGFSMPVSLARAKQKPLLKGKRVYITPHVKPDKKVVASLVTAVHGEVVDEHQICADKILDDLLILSCEEDYAMCRHFLKRGTSVYSSELLLNGIVIQKLELERHKLFVNEATKNIPCTLNQFGKVYRRRSRPESGS